MKNKMLVLFTLILTVFLTGCINQPVSHDIYVTVYPLQYITEEIVKGSELTVGIVPGVSSHQESIDWSPKEIIAMTEASYLFYVGANYDQYIDFQINSIFSNKDVELIKIEDQTAYIEFIDGVTHIHDEDESDHRTLEEIGKDPHFWISPKKVQQVSALVYDKLLVKYPDLENLMTANYDQLLTRLQTLSDAFQEVISNSPKTAMTSTNLYGYLTEDYGFHYFSISPGYHEEAEQFTTQEKEIIVNEAIEHDIQYLIYELNTTSPLSNAVFKTLESLGKNPIKVEYNILQALRNEDKNAGKNYVSIMYENLELLKLALGYVE